MTTESGSAPLRELRREGDTTMLSIIHRIIDHFRTRRHVRRRLAALERESKL